MQEMVLLILLLATVLLGPLVPAVSAATPSSNYNCPPAPVPEQHCGPKCQAETGNALIQLYAGLSGHAQTPWASGEQPGPDALCTLAHCMWCKDVPLHAHPGRLVVCILLHAHSTILCVCTQECSTSSAPSNC